MRASLLAVFLCMLFGANPVAVKISMTGVGVFTTAALRFAIAALVLTIWAKATGQTLLISRKQCLQLAFLGLIFFVQISTFYFGQNKTSASHGALFANALPFVVMILAHYLLPDDRITRRKVVGLLLGFSGVSLLFLDAMSLTGEMLKGDILLLLAVTAWGSNVIYVKRIIADFHPIQITVYPMIFALPLYFSAGYFFDDKMIFNLSTQVFLGIFYQSVVTASFGFVMWNTLIQRYGATALHSFVFLMPVSGVVLGVLLLGEPVTTNLIGAICLVTTGLIVINWRKRD